jgi:hypothetical protein
VGTHSLHTATATAILPAVNVPGYELEPGYTTQLPGSVTQQTFDTGLEGWTAGANSKLVFGTHPASGEKAMIVVRTGGAAGAAIASRAFSGLIVGRKYFISALFALPSPSNDRVLRLPATAGSIAAESGAGAGGYGTSFVATATTQTVQLIVDNVPAGDPGFEPVGMYVRDVKLFLLASSFYTPPVMQPPRTIAGGMVNLSVKSTSITLDDSWSPYAQATLVCYAPSIEILEALDPRKGLRVKVTVVQRWGDENGDWNSFGYRAPVVRTFDFSLRERAVDKQTGEMTLTLASDEALLLDYALVATTADQTPIGLQSSFRSIVNYVLGKVGAALAPGDDTHVTVSQSPNLFNTPSARRGLPVASRGWTSFGGTLGYDPDQDTYTILPGGTPTGSGGLYISELINVGPGEKLEPYTAYTYSANLYGSTTPVLPYVGGTGVAGGAVAGPAVSGYFPRSSVTFTTAGAGSVTFYVLNASPTAATGQHVYAVQDAQLEKGSVATPYFDGNKAADSKYTYRWQGAADASPSVRTLVTPRSEQLLDWTPGRSAWDFLEPIVQAAGYRLWCDEARVWHLAKSWNTQNQINLSPDNGLTAGVDRISRNEAWYDSVVIEYQWTDRAGVQQKRYDVAGVGGNSTLLLQYTDTPFPGAGAAASVLRRADGKGRIISPEAINNYLATPGDVVQISLPNSPVQTGLLSNVTWNLPEDRMQIASRGLTDTPANAWLNAVGPWTAATGPWTAAIGTN